MKANDKVIINSNTYVIVRLIGHGSKSRDLRR